MMRQTSVNGVFMIYRKARLGIDFEPGSRNLLLQSNEGNSDSGQKNHKDSEGNVQYAILVRSWGAFHHEGMSLQELEVMKKIDDLMDKAKIMKEPDLSEVRFYNCEDGNEVTRLIRGKISGDFSNTPLDQKDEVDALGRAYQGCIKDQKLTKKEIELLKRVDSVLPDASITINPQTGDATISSPKVTLDVSFSKNTWKYR